MDLFRERETPRLRASIRGLLPLLVSFVCLVLGVTGLELILGVAPDELLSKYALIPLAVQVFLLGVVTSVALWIATHLDRRHYSGYGLNINQTWLRDFIAGVVIALPVTVLLVGYIQIRGYAAVRVDISGMDGTGGFLTLSSAFVGVLGFILINNVYEEVVFRGIMLQNFAEGLRAKGFTPILTVLIAITASTVLFGLFHIILGENPARELITSGLTGIVFALAYVLTGRLGLSAGVHFGGVFLVSTLQESFFGFELPTILVMEPYGAAPVPYEVFVLRLLLLCVCIAGWAYLVSGDLRIAETVYRNDG